MKKNIVKTIIAIAIISITLLFIGILNNKKSTKESYARPDYDYIATVYHSEMLAIDEGIEYTYYIYRSSKSDNKYFYIKSKSDITIAGSGKKSDVGSGSLNDKNDLKKITKGIEKDSRKDWQSYISYSYANNEKIENISELGNKLFK